MCIKAIYPGPSPISTRLFASTRARRGSCVGRGLAYRERGDLNSALVDFSKAIEIDPGFADTFSVNRCVAYEDKGKPDLAVKDCTAAIALNPTDAVAYNDRGVAYEKTGNVDGALADYSKAIELDPSYRGEYVMQVANTGPQGQEGAGHRRLPRRTGQRSRSERPQRH